MRIMEAQAVARAWVAEQDGLEGAYLSGSTTWLPGDAELGVGSDVDIMVVTGRERPKLGKFRRDGVLLEVSYVSWEQLATPERVLADYHLAGGLRTNTILADPSGRLTALQAEVERHYAEPEWVRRRCAEIERRIADGLGRIDSDEQVMGWLFLTGVTTHVLLTAALRNPTVRLRYVSARELLLERGLPGAHEELLAVLGAAHLTPERVTGHLATMTRAFDLAAAVEAPPYPFASDITPEARPIAVDGAHALVQRGLHREAMFWIAATHARCATILGAPAPGYRELLADLGAASPVARARDTLAFLPRLRELKELILAG